MQSQYLQEAVANYQCKQYKEAIIKATKGLEVLKDDFHLLHLRANCSTALKNDKVALADLKLLIKTYPNEPRAYLKAVKCYQRQRQYDKALKVLEFGKRKVDRSDPKFKELEEKEYELAHSEKSLKLTHGIANAPIQSYRLILPVELMTIVLLYLPIVDRLKMSRLSQYWRKVVRGTSLLWRDLDLESYSRKIDKKSLEAIVNISKDRIQKLSLRNCSLISDLKSLISHRCKNIVYLDLSCTRVNSAALIEALRCMGKSLVNLILEDTRTDDTCLRRIFDICRSLQSLNVSKCPLISDQGFMVCDKFKSANISLSLTELWCSNMQDITDSAIKSVVDASPYLHGIDLSGCNRLTNKSLYTLSTISGWKWIALGGNSFTASNFKEHFSRLIQACSNLERLEIPKIPFVDDSIMKLLSKSCSRLQSINIKGCAHISTHGIAQLSLLSLRTINCSKCPKISEEAIQVLLNSNSCIESLDISSVSDKVLETIKDYSNIHSLYLSDSTVTNRQIIDLVDKPGLLWQNLHFSNCQKLSREAISHLSKVLRKCKVTAYFS